MCFDSLFFRNYQTLLMKQIALILTITFITLSGCKFFGPDKRATTKDEKTADGIIIKKKYFNDNPNAPVEWEVSLKPMSNAPAIKQGITKRYYKTGKLAEIIYYENNKKEGLRTTYHSTGKPYKEQPYKNNKLDGICKRYDRDGHLVAEYPYKSGLPGVGLKEYTNLGKERPAPVLVIKKIDNIHTRGSYQIVCSLSGEGAKRIRSVEFYQGKLIEDKYYHRNLTALKPLSGKKGQLTINVPKGASLNKTMNFIAVAKTSNGLMYIIHKKTEIDVRGV